MNTQQLQCFISVADKLNFTKAAEELYLSPPTVTHHIQTLEAELNTKLFIRTSKMVRLTEAGSFFYGDAKEILMKIDISKNVPKKQPREISAFFVLVVQVMRNCKVYLPFYLIYKLNIPEFIPLLS